MLKQEKEQEIKLLRNGGLQNYDERFMFYTRYGYEITRLRNFCYGGGETNASGTTLKRLLLCSKLHLFISGSFFYYSGVI